MKLYKKGRRGKLHKIQEFIRRSGLTQIEIAKALDVSAPTVSRWESGKFYPRKGKLLQLARLLNCTVDELLEEEK